MKNLFKIAFLCIPVLLAGCDLFDEDDIDDAGVVPAPEGFSVGLIYDYDITKCGCCGGNLIKIENNTYKFHNDDVAGTNPLNLIDAKLPIYVYLKWSPELADCSDRIIVQELRLASTH